ncbi:MAG: hypothetical protein LC808_05275 [Actinobacteria bacterium]|nr:hypothetical protein [Actinomycetota bacterium]
MTVSLIASGWRDRLLHYAAAAQLEWIRQSTGYTYERVCATLPKWTNPANFSRVLRSPPIELLEYLDDRILSLDPRLSSTGGLAALSVRLGREGSLDLLAARLPPAWRNEVMQSPATSEIQVLNKASGLLAELRSVPDNTHQVAARNKHLLDEMVKRLILIGAAPPTPRHVDALILLGSIAGTGTAFEEVERNLEKNLRENPLGFRIWRAVTAIVRTHNEPHRRPHTPPEAVQPWVREQVEAADERRDQSLYPARSLDLELFIATPLQWSVPSGGDDWIDAALRRRAQNETATVRERGTASHGLWRRALRCDDPEYRGRTEAFLRTLVGRFREEAQAGDNFHGLRWVAATLESNLDCRVRTTTTWPDDGRHYIALVRNAVTAALLEDLPTRIRPDTELFIEHSLLQNSGVIRRQAIDALAAGGWGCKIVPVYAHILNDPACESWLQCRTLLALSFLQERTRTVSAQLERSCKRAESKLMRNGAPESTTRGVVAEMHAALFAVGDCFGSVGAEALGGRLRTKLDTQLTRLLALSDQGHPDLFPIARAATYVLATTLQNGDLGTKEALHQQSQTHHDPLTKSLSEWAYSRFDRAGHVRPVHEMVE